MLAKLRERAPGAHTAIATAEGIPIPSRSIDVVVCAESFHWFDHPLALAEITRVLREDGHLALVWNVRDEGIPWVRKLGAIIHGGAADETAHAGPVEESEAFAAVEEQSFRNWQDLRKDELLDLVRTRSRVATLPEHQREDVLARIASLYDDYGRGPDGMRLPYLTRCYRAKVTNQPPPPVVMQRVEDEALSLLATEAHDDVEHSGPLMPGATKATVRNVPGATEDTGTVLIDFS
jgi:SAM-dependent methyltransferase